MKIDTIELQGLPREVITYDVDYTEEEIEGLKAELGEVAMKRNDLEIEKSNYDSIMKKQIDPLKDSIELMTRQIRNGKHSIKKECFRMVVIERKQIDYIDEFGEVVRTREMIPDEYQASLPFNLARDFTGTND